MPTGSNIFDILTQTGELLVHAAKIIGPGLGLIFCLSGLMKIKKKDDNPNEFSKGITYIIIGLACVILTIFVSWVLKYYGVDTSKVGVLN